MLTTASGIVTEIVRWWGDDVQELLVDIDGISRRALCYVAITDSVDIGDRIQLNTTAQTLRLGTGGFDFVMARLSAIPLSSPEIEGHILKARYTPCQLSVLTLEEQEKYAWIWERDLEGMPVLAGQLHSQMIPAAAGLRVGGCQKVVYIMTDAAALPIAFSKAVTAAREARLSFPWRGEGAEERGNFLDACMTCGQAFGGDYETVTLHSALLAARHLLNADAVVVCQGPGNAGTGTVYGFSGIEQASILDTASALGGTPVAIVRMSEADPRGRHRGISHHTLTSLRLVRSTCIVPLPEGTDASAVDARHKIRFVDGADAVVDWLASTDLPLSTMGRSIDKDRVFFLASAAAGLAFSVLNDPSE